MRLATSKLLIVILFAAFICLPLSLLHADDAKDSKPAFVDLDGDGFNDNASDADNDRIPDQAQKGDDSGATQESGFKDFNPIQAISDFDLSSLLANSEKFGKLKLIASAISCCRGGLEPDESFGPGNGIGSGAVSGGCPGGVCH